MEPIDNATRHAFLFGFASFVALQLCFAIWVHRHFAGNYAAPFPGGTPSSVTGYEAPSLVATLGGRLVGRSVTSPFSYHFVQFAFVALAVAMLAHWLVSRGFSPFYSLCWLFAMGPLRALWHGLPEASGDALLVISLVLFHYRRRNWLALTSALCLLTHGWRIYTGPPWDAGGTILGAAVAGAVVLLARNAKLFRIVLLSSLALALWCLTPEPRLTPTHGKPIRAGFWGTGR